eukprot:scaffold151722_cov21-Tisochrysis_lutea.AAC.1
MSGSVPVTKTGTHETNQQCSMFDKTPGRGVTKFGSLYSFKAHLQPTQKSTFSTMAISATPQCSYFWLFIKSINAATNATVH